jgi:threonine dehydrogenase-like Zn-dependent dehydrogenase
MLAAKQRGAIVHLADLSDVRLEFARKMGADGVVNLKNKALKDYVEEQTGDEGFNVTVEAVGSGDVFKQCIDAVSFHGRVCVIGMTTSDYSFNHSIISYKEIQLIGARNSNRQDFLDLIDMISSGRTDIEIVNRMATKEYSFKDVVEMFKSSKPYIRII